VPDFLASLDKMKSIAVERGVERIAMPRIGCGLDGLHWPDVKDAINKAFFETDIEILVCVL
jgi:O-acetyl-ADP-ribose deacetylase (regulator of RNase III)